MQNIELNAYIQAELFHTERWAGVPNTFRAPVVMWYQTAAPCEPRDYARDISAAMDMEQEIERLPFPALYNYVSWLIDIVEVHEDSEPLSTNNLFKLIHATPLQRATACVRMLQQRELQ